MPAPSASIVATASPTDSSPLLSVVAQQFQTMTATRYDHHFHEDPAAGIYYYDCVGMTTYSMRLAAPKALQVLLDSLKIRTGFVPTPSRYAKWFLGLEQISNPFWQAVTRVVDLQPGDVLAWNVDIENPNPPSPGHSVIAAGPPLPLSDGSWALLVYDSTATPHGRFDTRLTDDRNQIGPNGRPSGLGRGTLQLFADAEGRPNAIGWSVGGRRGRQKIGMARPLS